MGPISFVVGDLESSCARLAEVCIRCGAHLRVVKPAAPLGVSLVYCLSISDVQGCSLVAQLMLCSRIAEDFAFKWQLHPSITIYGLRRSSNFQASGKGTSIKPRISIGASVSGMGGCTVRPAVSLLYPTIALSSDGFSKQSTHSKRPLTDNRTSDSCSAFVSYSFAVVLRQTLCTAKCNADRPAVGMSVW